MPETKPNHCSNIVFIGLVTSSPDFKSRQVGYPLSFGAVYPTTGAQKHILVRPPEEWGGFTEEKKSKVEMVGGLRRSDLDAKGLPAEQAAKFIEDAVAEHEVYCLDVARTSKLLAAFTGYGLEMIKLNSALRLFNELAGGFERVLSIQLRSRLTIECYPRNEADVRWMQSCYRGCMLQR